LHNNENTFHSFSVDVGFFGFETTTALRGSLSRAHIGVPLGLPMGLMSAIPAVAGLIRNQSFRPDLRHDAEDDTCRPGSQSLVLQGLWYREVLAHPGCSSLLLRGSMGPLGNSSISPHALALAILSSKPLKLLPLSLA
jgi:hypothetical protein